MSWQGRLREYLLYAITAVIAALIVLVAAIHIEQRILRRRAERLFYDTVSLRVRSSTFAQAVDVFSKWADWGTYDIPCTKDYCNFNIAIRDIGGWSETIANIYQMAGSRLSGAGASISVRDGVVSQTRFEVGVDVPPFRDEYGRIVSYPLSAEIFTIPRAEPFRLQFPNYHPEYRVHWPAACTSCVVVEFQYTPYAHRDEINRLARPNFDCITSWKQCRTKADILPAAMAQSAGDPKLADKNPSCSLESVHIASRDAEDAAVVDVVANRAYSECDGCRLLEVRLVQRLKRAGYWPLGSTLGLGVVQLTALPAADDRANLNRGDRLIAVFDRNFLPMKPASIIAEPCGLLRFTPDNLQLVAAGIREDTLVHLPTDLDLQPPPRKFSDPPLPPVPR